MSRRRLFGSLCSLVFLVNLGRVVFAPLLEPLRASFGVSVATVGLLATFAWLGSALPRVPTGYLLTRVPRHSVILVSGTVLAIASMLAALAPSIEVLFGGALLMGLSSGVYFVAANPLVSELFPEGVGRALGIHGMANQLAAAGAPLFVAGVLFVADWRVTFASIGIVALLATTAFYAIARRATLPDAGRDDRDFLGAARRQWPLILSGVAIIGTMGFVWNGLFNFYVTYLIAAKAVSADTARILLTIVFAAGIPAFVVTGRLADRLPYVPLLLAIIAGFVACLLALTVATGLLSLVVVSVVLGYVVHSLFPAMDTYLLDSLPDQHRASAYAVYSGAMMLVQAFGSSAVGTLVEVGYGFDAVFGGFAAGLLVVLFVLTGLHLAGRLPTGTTPTRRV